MIMRKNLRLKILGFFLRKAQSWIFTLRHPHLLRAEYRNPGNIRVSDGVSIGKDSRVFAAPNSPITLGSHSWIGRRVEVQTSTSRGIDINTLVSIQDNCKILGSVCIGAYSTLAPNVFISSGNHQFKHTPKMIIKLQDQLYPAIDKPVKIGEDCWLGVNVFVAQGVTIGRGAIVGANSVVLKDVPPYSVFAGSPAAEVGKRTYYQPKRQIIARSEDQIYFISGFDHSENFTGRLRGRSASVSLNLLNARDLIITLTSESPGILSIFVDGLCFAHPTQTFTAGTNELRFAINDDSKRAAPSDELLISSDQNSISILEVSVNEK